MTCLFGQKPRKEEKGKAINLDKRKGRDKSKRRKEGAVENYFPKKKKKDLLNQEQRKIMAF